MKSTSGTTQAASAPKRPIWRFIALFALWVVVFYAATALPWFSRTIFPAYLELNARVSGAVLNLLGEGVTVNGPNIIAATHMLSILRGCDAIEPTALLVAGVLAFPATWRRRLAGVVIGVLTLAALNLVRIITLYYIGLHAPKLFEVFHVDVWQIAFIFAAMLLWMVWAWRAIPSVEATNTARSPVRGGSS